MRRSELEVGKRYLGPSNQCYEIYDLSPGWREFAGVWIEDSSTRYRTVNGHKVAFRKNNALRAFLHQGGVAVPTVITPNRLVRTWDSYETYRTNNVELEKIAKVTLTSLSKIVNSQGYKPGHYEILEGGEHVTIPLDDLRILVAFAEES